MRKQVRLGTIKHQVGSTKTVFSTILFVGKQLFHPLFGLGRDDMFLLSLYCCGQKFEELLINILVSYVQIVQTSNLYWISLEDRMAGWELELNWFKLLILFSTFCIIFPHNEIMNRGRERSRVPD